MNKVDYFITDLFLFIYLFKNNLFLEKKLEVNRLSKHWAIKVQITLREDRSLCGLRGLKELANGKHRFLVTMLTIHKSHSMIT